MAISPMTAKQKKTGLLSAVVLVSALGYFVDIYDLLLFSIVRVASLKDLGVPDSQMLAVGLRLLNFQMTGMLIGGLIWGLLGDKKGRLSVLFGSILLYSLANLANGFVHSLELYGLLRFLAGLGLAGELGAAVTLVAEILPKEKRGYGTAIVAGVGILGAVVASLVGDRFAWRTSYEIGGALGILLLILRISVVESGMYASMKEKTNIRKGDLFLLLNSPRRILKYLACCCLGLPLWFVVGILITLSPELARELGIQGTVTASRAVLFSYAGLCVGDIASGALSQFFGSRKKVLFGFMMGLIVSIFLYASMKNATLEKFYLVCSIVGFFAGFWAVFVTVAAEQFGTNLRATVAITAPNFVRGAVLPITAGFNFFHQSMSPVSSAVTVGMITIGISLLALSLLKETHGEDLDYFEVD